MQEVHINVLQSGSIPGREHNESVIMSRSTSRGGCNEDF